MASKRPSVLKREREKKQAERSAQKREERSRRSSSRSEGGAPIATSDELADYGIVQPAPRDHDAL